MMRFTSLERAGLGVAVISDKTDGDCGSRPEMRANVQAFLERSGRLPRRLVRLRQVHGNRVVEAGGLGDTPGMDPVEADGMFTDEPGIALGISVADCAPVMLYDPLRRVIAALHAGREGTLCNIAAAGVHALAERFACSPASLLAVVGPCAGPCCYEVSPECAERWRAAGLPARHRHLDLGTANRMQLEKAGLIRHNIEVVPHCTVCGGVFFSYRAGEISNRNLVVMML